MEHASRQARLDHIIAGLGYSFDGPIRIGGDYVSIVRDGTTAYVSGQVPRVGETVVVTGPAGSTVDLAQAQRAAQVCAIRALVLLQQSLGSLDAIRQVLKVNVYTQSDPAFTRQSEVADAASALLKAVLGEAGAHTRTSIGVLQLPKNATVELDMVVATHESAHGR
ncbi:MAG TPA: RidA family protein [Ramlibacter sp.]|nr:RidA family protein [Ramlibacter sp.]